MIIYELTFSNPMEENGAGVNEVDITQKLHILNNTC